MSETSPGRSGPLPRGPRGTNAYVALGRQGAWSEVDREALDVCPLPVVHRPRMSDGLKLDLHMYHGKSKGQDALSRMEGLVHEMQVVTIAKSTQKLLELG